MALNRIRLGDYIEKSTANNHDLTYGIELIEGVTSQGIFDSPKGNPLDVDLTPYKIVNNGAFVYNPTRLNLGSIAYRTEGMCIVSHLYMIFYLNIEGRKRIDPIWLYIYLRREEFRREVTFRNFGSQRPEFNFYDMSDIEIPLPDIDIQRKYADIYKALLANQQSYECGLDDLRIICAAYFDKNKTDNYVLLGDVIEKVETYNSDCNYGVKDVKGMTITKEIIPTKANVKETDLSKFIVVGPDEYVYNPRTHGKKIGLGYNNTGKAFIISWNNIAFRIKSKMKNSILPQYLYYCFRRDEWDREACYNSWGSSTEVFSWESLCEMKIPFPSIDKQKIIAEMDAVYNLRKAINVKIKNQINSICPILIKGSIEEARKEA